jgi:hypothetical protein
MLSKMALRLLPIARPCTESFADMPGDEKTRFCAKCGRTVHDLSAGTEAEAREIFERARGERVCARFARDASGAVRFRAAAIAAAVSLAACSSAVSAEPAPQTTTNVVDYELGDVVPDETDRCPDPPSATPTGDGCPTATPAAPHAPDAGR